MKTSNIEGTKLLPALALVITVRLAAQSVPASGNTPPPSPPNSDSGGMRAPSGSSTGSGAFYSGTVALDDGSPLPTGIAIQRVCSTVGQTVALTDAEGHFSFQPGASTGPMLDASQSGGRNAAGVMGTLPWVLTSSSGAGAGMPTGSSSALGPVMSCEVRAVLAGYRSDSISLANRHTSDNPDLGVIVLHHATGSSAKGKVSVTTLAAPKSAVDAYTKALKSMHAGDAAGAKKNLERAVGLYPGYAEAWMELGFLNGRGHAWTESARCLDQGLSLNPGEFPQAWYADAMAHYYLGEFDPAERSAREAVRLDPGRRNPRAGYVLGMILAQKRDFGGAAEALRSYLQQAPNAPDIGQVKLQLAEIESRHQEGR